MLANSSALNKAIAPASVAGAVAPSMEPVSTPLGKSLSEFSKKH